MININKIIDVRMTLNELDKLIEAIDFVLSSDGEDELSDSDQTASDYLWCFQNDLREYQSN